MMYCKHVHTHSYFERLSGKQTEQWNEWKEISHRKFQHPKNVQISISHGRSHHIVGPSSKRLSARSTCRSTKTFVAMSHGPRSLRTNAPPSVVCLPHPPALCGWEHTQSAVPGQLYRWSVYAPSGCICSWKRMTFNTSNPCCLGSWLQPGMKIYSKIRQIYLLKEPFPSSSGFLLNVPNFETAPSSHLHLTSSIRDLWLRLKLFLQRNPALCLTVTTPYLNKHRNVAAGFEKGKHPTSVAAIDIPHYYCCCLCVWLSQLGACPMTAMPSSSRAYESSNNQTGSILSKWFKKKSFVIQFLVDEICSFFLSNPRSKGLALPQP